MGVTVMTSVLFTDLVDSTATASRLGPVGSEELRRTHFGLLRAVVEATGGTEVKNLGDGLMVAFTSPSRALACATGMQQSIARHNERAAEPLSVRVGLSVGEAVEEDGDYFGDPVVEAARLCAAATGGQILTTDIVRALAGRHAPQDFVDLGPISLKGIPEPVAAVEVRWDPLVVEGGVPLPMPLASATRDGLFGFHGRTAELVLVEGMRKRAFTDPCLRTVLVGGEAGIGKTTFIAQAAASAHAAGAIVLLGHCDEDLTVPYQPWIEALTHLVRHLGPGCVEQLTPMHRAALARLVPMLGGETGPRADAADSERLVMIHAVEAALASVAADTPVVVVLDDLHWADAASLHLLRHLVEQTAEAAVLVLCTYRDSDLGRDHPLTALLADLHRQPGVKRLPLAGLDDAETLELLTHAAGHELDDDGVTFAHSLRRETDGNPFFTGELLRHLGESGRLYQGPGGRWTIDVDLDATALPPSIRDVVERRVARLGAEAGRTLSLASVIGRDFTLDLLAAIAERSEDDVLDVLEAATTAAVVGERADEPGSYRFSHALIQRTLYEDLSAARRTRTHRRIAEALEVSWPGGPGRAAELARHWVAGARPNDHDFALGHVMQAADEALHALAPDDAIGWYGQALDLAARHEPVDDARRGRLLVGLGTAQRQIGAAEYRDTLSEAVGIGRRIDDAELLVAAVLAADRGVAGTSGLDAEWVEATEAALEAAGPDDSGARARLLSVLSQAIDSREWERRRDLSAEAVDVARRIGDDAALLAIVMVAYQHRPPEDLDRRLADSAEAIALADRLGDPRAGCSARFHRIDACLQAGDRAEFEQRLAELDPLARSTELPLHLWQLQMMLSLSALLDGRCDDAEAAATAALDIGTAGGHSEAMLAFGAQLLEVRRHQGRLDEIVEMFGAVATDDVASGFTQVMGSLYADVGRIEDARPLLARDAADDFAGIPRDEGWLSIMHAVAATAVAVGDHDACRALSRQLTPYAGRVAAVYATMSGATAQVLGRLALTLGDHAAAEAHLEAALALHERLRAPYLIACTQLDLCDLLVARRAPGDAERARGLAAAADRAATAHGYAGLLERARQVDA